MKAVAFSMRFSVRRSTMTDGQTAETTIRRSACTVDHALALGRAALEGKGWTVGKCTDCRTKRQSFHTEGR